MLVLAAAVATPTLSAAQDPAVTVPEQPPAPLTPPTPPPAQPAQPQEPPGKQPAEKQPAKDEGSSGEAEAPAPTPPPAQVQVSAATQSSGTARASASATVSVGDNFYSPRSVSIAIGDTVTWNNNGQAPHTATADNGSFDTGSFGPGQSRSNSFNSAGTISYYCTIHGRVQSGTVRVLAASGGGSGGGGSSGSSGAGQSEAAAVAAPDAAGTSTSLPATGFAAIGLALVGFALLAGGHVVGRLDGQDRRARRRFLPIY